MITRLLEMARKRSCDKSRDVMDPLTRRGTDSETDHDSYKEGTISCVLFSRSLSDLCYKNSKNGSSSLNTKAVTLQSFGSALRKYRETFHEPP